MANDLIVDVDGSKESDVTQLVSDLTESIHQNRAPKDDKPAPAARPSYIEEKYWTGNVEESLTKQYEGFKKLQSTYGQMANDLGTQRRLTDELIGLKRQNDLRGTETPPANQPKPLPKLTASALLEKPDAALDEYLTAREQRLASAYEARINQLESALTGVQLQSKHGDYSDLVTDPNWKQWLVSDPARAHLAQLAAQGDQIIADQLITQYKAEHTAKPAPKADTPAPAAPQGERIDPNAQNEAVLSQAAKHALASAASSDTGSRKGKVYSRAALMRLKATQPDVYEDPNFQSEILKAYSEGRVK